MESCPPVVAGWYQDGDEEEGDLPIVESCPPVVAGWYEDGDEEENDVEDDHTKADPVHCHVANQTLTVGAGMKNITRLIEMWNLKTNNTIY